MTRAAKPAAPELVTDWIPCTTPPVRDGVYEFQYIGPVAPTFFHRSVVRGVFKSGKWYSANPGCTSTLDGLNRALAKYQWRGVRRWVLVRKADPLLTALFGVPTDAYLEGARPRSAKFNVQAHARPFKTEREAQRFADRYSDLGLTAVLP